MSWIKGHPRTNLGQLLSQAIDALESARDTAQTPLEVSELITEAMKYVSSVSRATVQELIVVDNKPRPS
jgi:hypothetical protein